LGWWLAYTIIFICASTHFILKTFYDAIGATYALSGLHFLTYFTVLSFILGIWVCYLANKTIFKALLREMPILGVINNEVIILLGLITALKMNAINSGTVIQSNPNLLCNSILLGMAIFFASLFAAVKCKGENADARNHVGAVSREFYGNIANTCFGLSLLIAMQVDAQSVFFALLFMGVYYIYSVYPLRIKRAAILSRIAIAANSCFLILSGYWVGTHNFYLFSDPNSRMIYTAALFALFMLAANNIDLTDTEEKISKVKSRINSIILLIYLASLIAVFTWIFKIEPKPQIASTPMNQKITDLITDYNDYFKLKLTSFDQIKKDAFTRVHTFYTAVQHCQPGTYQYILRYLPGIVFYTSVIEGKQNGNCVVKSTFTIPDKTKGTKTCHYTQASQSLFTNAQADFDGSGYLAYDNAKLTPFQQAELNDCQYVGKLAANESAQ
jgi:hypothetical protein